MLKIPRRWLLPFPPFSSKGGVCSSQGCGPPAWTVSERLFQSKQFGACERTVDCFESGGEFLHGCVIGAFCQPVGWIGASGFQSGEHEHSACRAARQPHPSDSAAKRCRHAQCCRFVDSVKIGKGGNNRLRTIVSFLKFSTARFILSSYIACPCLEINVDFHGAVVGPVNVCVDFSFCQLCFQPFGDDEIVDAPSCVFSLARNRYDHQE